MTKTAAEYRDEVAHYYSLARRAETQEIRHHLLEIARHYEELAERAARSETATAADKSPIDPG
jgi:hypothetical protein